MVGVAGRSKGCVTCRQRKIRCSFERPECRVCIKSSRHCGGYHRDRVFILDARTAKNVQPKVADVSPDRNSVAESIENGQQQLVLKTVDKMLVDEPISPFSFWQFDAHTKQLDPLRKTISTHSAFSSLWGMTCPSTRSCYRQQILSEFLHSYYAGADDPAKADSSSGGWLTMLPDLPDFTTALEAAVLAICTARLGRINGDKALVKESLKFYTQGLWELQKALWNPSLMYRDETVAACMILLMYEVLECPDKNIAGWLGHIRGCAKLVELKGPKAYVSEFGHRLFVTFRQLEIQQAIVERRATFLADPVWVEKPWKNYTKPINQDLLDLMAEMAGIGEAGYYPKNPENPFLLAAELLAVVHRCWALDAKLQAFYRRLERETAGPLYRPIESAVVNPLTEVPTFPVTYEFSDLGIAHTCMLYWATCSILWSGLVKIYEILNHLEALMKMLAHGGPDLPGSLSTPVSETIPSPTSLNPTCTATTSLKHGTKEDPASSPSPPGFVLPPLEHRSDIPAMALLICQSLPNYEIHLTKAGLPMTTLVFPLKVAIEGFCGIPEYEKELAWTVAKFEMLIGTGAQLLGHLGREVTDKSYLSG